LVEFGILVSSVDDIDLVVRAEELGYDYCWAPDSQLMYSNPFAVLALAAQQTRTIRLGTGLAVAGLRLAPVVANGIATINRLAPGRTFLGLGTGNTAMRTIGQRPMPVARFGEYVRVVRALLDGDELDYALNGSVHKIRFQSDQLGHIGAAPIPIHVGAIGPKAQALAGEFGDAVITSFPRGGTLPQVQANLTTGAARHQRDAHGLPIYALMNLLLLEPDETLNSPRALAQCGSAIMANVHYLVDLHRDTGADPPDYVRPIWDDYLAFHATRDKDRAHQQLHQSHYAYLEADEARFVTPEIIRNFCLAGQPDEIIQRLHELEADGLTGVNFALPTDTARQLVEQFANQVLNRYLDS
jgi:5,10-methylenetetrahydromethanopterin reductase